MRLTKRLPGVSGVDISFRGVPKVDVSVRPVGLPVADVPGLYQWIMGKIEEVICKKFWNRDDSTSTSRENFYKKSRARTSSDKAAPWCVESYR